MDNLIEIRWHGRGGQGAKTASLLLADAAFNTGKYIQGFPEYGPERMGAPITAYNRISDTPITVHSNIYEPDYVVVVDDTLLEAVPVTEGLKETGAIVINTTKSPEYLKEILKDYKGKRIILYFYPRDNTPGCTKQACGFAENYPLFVEKDVIIIGISKDSVASHKKFEMKYNLPFILLSDPQLQAIQDYDVWKEKNMYGKKVQKSQVQMLRQQLLRQIMKMMMVKKEFFLIKIIKYFQKKVILL